MDRTSLDKRGWTTLLEWCWLEQQWVVEYTWESATDKRQTVSFVSGFAFGSLRMTMEVFACSALALLMVSRR